MLRTFLPAAAALLTLATSVAVADQGPKWAVDPVHSTAQFTATHLGISHVTGTIAIKNAQIIIPDGSDVPTSMSATLDPSQVDTRYAQRDNDLNSSHFFDAGNFKDITFQSTQVTGTASDFDVKGNLTMHGVTKPVELHGKLLGRGKGMRGEPRVAYEATGTLNRSDWGMTYALTPPIVGDQIQLQIDVEASKQ